MDGRGADGPEDVHSERSPCLSHGCVVCCLETEMPLTEDDLRRIEKLSFRRADFTVEVDGETRLRNVRGVCFFLEGGRCRIYGGRPEGCRVYPLVYNIDSHKFVHDPVCPHSGEFEVTKADKERLKRLIRRLDRETAKR